MAEAQENPNEANTDLVTVRDGDKLKHVTRAEYDKNPENFKKVREQDGAVVISTHPGGQKNPSGTYSMPTPTDIRYPDKNATEFENNHGAFLGKSAAGLRKQMGIPDIPGGVRPLSIAEVKPVEGKEGEYAVYYGDQPVITGLTADDQKAFEDLPEGDDVRKAEFIAKAQTAMDKAPAAEPIDADKPASKKRRSRGEPERVAIE